MRYSVALLAAAFLCGCASNKYIPVPAADLESEKGAQTVAQFPPISSGQTTYTINSTQTRLNIQNLVLPDNFILDAAPDVKQIRWTVQNVQIGKKVLIDLSAKGVPAKQPTERPARQADYCKWGKTGSDGRRGQAGYNSISATITEIVSINNNGSLWIRTDGGKGGTSGDGQRGQQGGGHWASFPPPFCGAGQGGRGGEPGPLAEGGHVSQVFIALAEKPNEPYVPQAVTSTCGRTAPPKDWDQGGSTIVILGSRGCKGEKGVPGKKGAPGLVPVSPENLEADEAGY